MKKHIKHIVLLILAITAVIGLSSKHKSDDMVMLTDIVPKEKYSHTAMMETGGLYRLELYNNNDVIKKCDLKVNKDTLELISENNTEIVSFLDFNYNTIALLSDNNASSMILKIESDGKGYIRADLIGVVAEDIVGEYKLVYKDKDDFEENIIWNVTGAVTFPDNTEATPEDMRIMCLSEDKGNNVYLEIFNGKEWESYSFYILGNTIFLEQIFG